MSIHFSRFALNTYSGTPYFRAHIPDNYPLSLVLQKSRAFNRLPSNLHDLSERSKKWSDRMYGPQDEIKQFYDEDGNELDPSDGHVLTDEEIDAQWPQDDQLENLEVEDIPIPEDGFADPDTWEQETEEEEESDDDGRWTEETLTKAIKEHGRKRVARESGISDEQLESIESDEDLVREILGTEVAQS